MFIFLNYTKFSFKVCLINYIGQTVESAAVESAATESTTVVSVAVESAPAP